MCEREGEREIEIERERIREGESAKQREAILREKIKRLK